MQLPFQNSLLLRHLAQAHPKKQFSRRLNVPITYSVYVKDFYYLGLNICF